MNPDHHHNSLNQHDRLHWYEIITILGQGGFGITYLARDVNLDQNVAIKEYLPTEFSTRDASKTVQPISQNHTEIFDWGKARFLDEAKTLSSFKHPNIVRVLSFFENNNTGYMVMEYEEGQDFSDLIKAGEVFNEERLLEIIIPILDGLEQVHSQGFIHRDIKPQNIFIRTDGSPVLIDFGSARQAMGGQTRTMTSLVTPGFAPFEQYHDAEGKQGPWTDIYALGATLYSAVTGKPPKDALKRSMAQVEYQTDAYLPLVDLKSGDYSEHFLQAIDMALAFFGRNRPQSVTDWKKMLLGEMPVEIAPKAADPIAPPTTSAAPTTIVAEIVAEPPAGPTRVNTITPSDPTQLNTENPVQPVTEDPADPTRLNTGPGSGVDFEVGPEPESVEAITEVRSDPTRVNTESQPAAEVSAKGVSEQPIADSPAPAIIPEAKKPAEVKPAAKVPTPTPTPKVAKARPAKLESGEAESKKKSGRLIPLLVVVVAAVVFGIYWQGRSPGAVSEPRQTTSIDEQQQTDLTQQATEKKELEALARQADEKQEQAELAKQADEKKEQEALTQQAAEEQKQAELAKQTADKQKQAELAKQTADKLKQAELAKQTAEKLKQAELAKQQATETQKQAELASQAALAKQAAAKKKQAEIARKAAARKKQERLARQVAEKKKQEEADKLAAEQKKQAELALLAATKKAQEEADRQAALAEVAKSKAFDVTGRYTAEIVAAGQNQTLVNAVMGRKPNITVELKQDGDKITGKIAGSRIGDLDGTIKGDKIEYDWYTFGGSGKFVPSGGNGVWTISSDGLLLEGDWRSSGYSVGGSWNLKRQ